MLIGLLFFSHAAFAINPCLDAAMSGSAAVAASEEHEGCETVVLQANLCLLECSDGLSGSASASLPPVSQHVLNMELPFEDGNPARVSRAFDHPARDPPKCIRFCSYLV